MPFISLYLCLALLIGVLGRKHRWGFLGFFFVSFLLTPLVGALLLSASATQPSATQPAAARRPDGTTR